MKNPYEILPEKAFWKLSVSDRNMFNISGIWEPKFEFKKDQQYVTFGSCFAQHIGSSLKSNGFDWFNAELPPFGMSKANCYKFNYNVFSARTGNIYTTSLLSQWVNWAVSGVSPSIEVWHHNGRFYDPFRPNIEPSGFKSYEELSLSLAHTIECFKKSIESADYFVYTLGLTESWVNKKHQYEYSICPGTVAGHYDSDLHQFINLQFDDVRKYLINAIEKMRSINPGLRFILTVSPVPLVATNSGQHVLVATMSSKSILRAVAGQLADDLEYVAYFPSFEIINSPVFKGAFFEPNQRGVSSYGVDFVMSHFFGGIDEKHNGFYQLNRQDKVDEICDEELLESFVK